MWSCARARCRCRSESATYASGPPWLRVARAASTSAASVARCEALVGGEFIRSSKGVRCAKGWCRPNEEIESRKVASNSVCTAFSFQDTGGCEQASLFTATYDGHHASPTIYSGFPFGCANAFDGTTPESLDSWWVRKESMVRWRTSCTLSIPPTSLRPLSKLARALKRHFLSSVLEEVLEGEIDRPRGRRRRCTFARHGARVWSLNFQNGARRTGAVTQQTSERARGAWRARAWACAAPAPSPGVLGP